MNKNAVFIKKDHKFIGAGQTGDLFENEEGFWFHVHGGAVNDDLTPYWYSVESSWVRLGYPTYKNP